MRLSRVRAVALASVRPCPASARGAATAPGPAPRAVASAAAILKLNQQLLDYVMAGDWTGYASLCDPSLTCFEAEARGALAQGLGFHKIYYDHAKSPPPPRVATQASPHVRFVGPRCAVLSYVRLVQSVGADGAHSTARTEETRVWERQKSGWKLVHFHKGCA